MALNVKNLEGNELADDYTRKASTRGRWGETWDVFKGNFGKIVLINIFMLICMLPAVAVFIVRSLYINGMGMQFPFNANTGIGYPAYPGTQGLTESIYLSADILFYSLLVVSGFIASIGISGGAYSLKKLVNTQGQFTIKGFFHGVKVGYFNTVLPVTVFLLFYFGTVLVGDWMDLQIALGNPKGGPITAYVFAIIATVLVGLYCAWLLATGVSYKLKITQLIRNSFVLLIACPLQTVLIAGFALIPVWILLLGSVMSLFSIIAYVIFILFGFSFAVLVWMSYTQWVFDLFVTPNLKAAAEEIKAKKTPQELEREKKEEEKRVALELLAAGKSELIGKPILPLSEEVAVAPLGKTYSRASLKKVSEDRAKLGKEIADYEEAHKNDPVYAEYNKLFADREKALQATDKKQKKKKVSSDNLLK